MLPVQATVESLTQSPFRATIPTSLTKIVRVFAGGSLASITKAIFAYRELWDSLLQKVTSTLDEEFTQLSKRSSHPTSLFCRIPLADTLPQLRWSDYVAELEKKAPVTLQLIVSKKDSRNQKKCGNPHFPGICMSIAIRLKERNREMCHIQTLLSLLLFSLCVQKQVNNVFYVTIIRIFM